MSVKPCWQCGGVFGISYRHIDTGYNQLICAVCYAPRNLNDRIGLEIMKSLKAKEAISYAKAWENILKKRKKKSKKSKVIKQ